MKPGLARKLLMAACLGGLFTLVSSLFFSWYTVRLAALGFDGIVWAFWRYVWYLAPYPGDGWALLYSAGVGAVPCVAIFLLPQKYTAGGAVIIRRGHSGIHGDTRWLSMVAALAMLGPDTEDGVQVVLGEAIQMDLTPYANVRFEPKKESTWGPGGTGELLFDKGEEMGGGHGITYLAPGGGKTQEIATAIAYYGKSVFVLDPACELADMTREIQEEKRHTTYVLDPDGDTGFNALSWININDPLADVNVRVQVGRMYGKTSEKPGQGGQQTQFFRDQGKNLVVCLMAHMLWHPDAASEHKTLRAVRKALVQPQAELRDTLEGIHETSHSELARDLAGPLFKMVDETFDGIASNAQEATAWLSVRPYANMVSGGTYDPAELCNGKTTIYCQIPLKALIENPEVARTVVGAHMGAIMEAEGEVNGRVLFKLDEAVLLGSDNMLRVGRSQGRKYRLILCPYYQSLGQALEVWGGAGLRAWMGEVSWIRFGPTMDGKDAKELTDLLGTFGAMATSHGKNKGSQGRFGEAQSSSSGTTENEHEVKVPLLYPFQLQRLRRDERIVLYTNSEPMRITAALAHRRPELRSRMGKNRFRRPYPRPGLRRVA